MNYADTQSKLSSIRQEILGLRQQLREVQQQSEAQTVENYVFKTGGGEVTLRDLFGDKTDLFVVHNMGTSCSYCTLWADGCNGVYDHLADRAGFVVSSPDSPQVQQEFAAGRGWRFPMVSHQGSNFAQDMGYGDDSDSGGWMPGLSVFQRRGDEIVRVSDQPWGPGDDFCSVWHFYDMLPEGANDWSPKFKYG